MEDVPIAIVGMGCRFGGARDPRAFWRAVSEGRPCFSPLLPEAAMPIGVKSVFGAAYPSAGCQLGELYSCRPSEQTFPRQINSGENQDLYFATQLAFDALSDAGMRPRSPEPRRGTVRFAYAPVFNTAVVNWLDHTFFMDQTLEVLHRCFPGATDVLMDNVRTKLRDSLPAPNADALAAASGFRIADWIARESSFSGAASAFDSGALSCVAAIESAVSDLVSGKADVALAGAVSPPLNRAVLEGLSGKVKFSEAPELHPFDTGSDGTLPGEGGAFFVLKRRTDALAAHDRIYALIRSISTGSGFQTGECAEAAKTPLNTIAMIEADGSGIPEADMAEVEEIQRLWGPHRAGGPLVGIGSVKGNVGHCFAAAAAPSLVKAIQSVHMRVLTPQVPVQNPIGILSHIGSSAYLLDRAMPWITGDPLMPRRAIVCTSDFDGRKSAMMIEEEPENRE